MIVFKVYLQNLKARQSKLAEKKKESKIYCQL